VVFFLFLWFGMLALAIDGVTAITIAVVSSFFIFVFVRTHGGDEPPA
jgi:hypothetical protein